jgi:8-amino-7-oxononanoate synthase
MMEELQELEQRSCRRARRLLESAQGPVVTLGNRRIINFSSNDYLSLAADPRLQAAASEAMEAYGCGAGASALISGYSIPTRRLEEALAHWHDAEAALVFSSGYAANQALTSTLAQSEDVVFSDELNHASLIDACRLSRGSIHVYPHNDMSHLESQLALSRARRKFIVSDSVFSMDGDFSPISSLLELACRFDAMVLLDEAHATGVLGSAGRGLSSGIRSSRLVKVGTLSKALGSQGGFVVGSRLLIDWLVNRARPYIFSTALGIPMCAAAERAIQIVREEPHRSAHVIALGEQVRTRLRQMGRDVGASQCQIVPVILGEADRTMAASQALLEEGFFVPGIRPPSVKPGSSRLRISLTSGHTQEHIDGLLAAMERLVQRTCSGR